MPPIVHSLLGIISPPSPGRLLLLAERIVVGLPSVDGVPLRWNEDSVSSTRDAGERNGAETLLLTVAPENVEEAEDGEEVEVAPERIVARVDELLNGVANEETNGEGGQGGERKSYFVEHWATSPVPLPLRPIGASYDGLLAVPDERWGVDAPQVMTQFGVVLQRRVLEPDEVTELRETVDRAIANVDALLAKHRPELDVGEDSFVFREIASRNLQRFDLRMDEVAGASAFVERCVRSHARVQSLLQSSLGAHDEIDFDVSVVYSRPGAVDQRWHADGEHLRGADERDPPYALCLFLPLIDLNEEVGYTQFWPGSHRSKQLVGFGPIAELTGATYDGICKKGSGVWYDYRLLHRGMRNVSTVVRPVVQVIFKKRWYVERRNYGTESIVVRRSDDE